jgi:hypothetical protein
LPATRCTKSTWHLLDTEAIAGPPPAVASHARNNNRYGAHSSHPTTCLFRSHDDGDALWERGYDRRQNVRRAGRNIYARSDVDSPTAPRAIFSVPADQLRKLGLLPGAHLRVVEAVVAPSGGRLAGSLPELPDLAWEDFERGSELARRDAEASCG